VFSNIQDCRWQDLTLGLTCIVVLFLLKEVRSVRWSYLDDNSRSQGQRVLRGIIFYVSAGRNAIVVIIASVIAYGLDGDRQPFTISGVLSNPTTGRGPLDGVDWKGTTGRGRLEGDGLNGTTGRG
ncbi:hypothetical protein OTU49_001986, partial [Cherax quadricarinatus]